MIGVERLAAPPVRKKEILRYASARAGNPQAEALMEECLAALLPDLRYQVCFLRLPVLRQGKEIVFGGQAVVSKTLSAALTGCEEFLLFAATVGVAPDRLIAQSGAVAPSKALFYQAIGAERIEALCDAFAANYNKAMQTENKRLLPRISPGYGDLSLSLQKTIFAMLDCPRKIGLTLNDSLMMSPSKSVTALAGIAPGKAAAFRGDTCLKCGFPDCAYRTED